MDYELTDQTSEFQERLEFEKLLFNLSERFINIYGDQIGEEIKKSLQKITEFFEVDRSSFFKFSDDHEELQLLNSYSKPGVEKTPKAILKEQFPLVLQKLIQNEVVAITDTEDFISKARIDKKFFSKFGLKSILAIPLKTGGELKYVFSIAALHTEHDWPEELIPRLQLLGEIFANSLMRNRARNLIDKRLQFEQLITDLAAAFSAISSKGIDELINDSLNRLGEFLGAERCSLGLFSEDKTQFVNKFAWASAGFAVPPGFMGPVPPEMYWFPQQTLAGEVFMVDTDDLPAEAEAQKAFMRRENIKSVLLVPMQAGNDVIGTIVFDTVSEKRTWSSELVKRLSLFATVIATALVRQKIAHSLEISKSLMTTFMNYSPAWMYLKDKSRNHLFANRSFLENLNTTLDEFVGTTSYDFLPEDVARMMDEYDNKVIEQGCMLEIDNLNTQMSGRTIHIRDIKFPVTLNSGEDGIGGVVVDITSLKQKEKELEKAYEEIKTLKNQLEEENILLIKEMKLLHSHDDIVGKSTVIKSMLSQAEQVAEQDTSVLILGETGTGKELLAHAIHNMSPRKDRAMVIVNCASLSATLIEGELFGREKGAYTGALTKQSGRFEIADKSTIFLDEIGDLPLEMQAKLLRVLQEGKFERLGSTTTITVDVRVIAATNHDLEQAVAHGKFRKDLFYRLSVFPVTVPPLTERRDDIPLLTWSFVKEFSKRMGKTVEKIPKKTMEMLQEYSWPGNVRELRNVIERAMILHSGSTLTIAMGGTEKIETGKPASLQDVDRQHILSILEQTHWKVSGKNGAAELLGLKESTLRARMKKLGIKRGS